MAPLRVEDNKSESFVIYCERSAQAAQLREFDTTINVFKVDMINIINMFSGTNGKLNQR